MAKRDVVDAVSTVLAVLAMVLQVLLALVAVIALAALVSRRGRRALVEARETLLGSELWFAWVVAFAATAGSLFFSEYADFIPCRLCWFQRIAMYPLAVVLLVAALRRDRRAGVQYAVAFPIAGVAVAAYHIYIEQHPEAESAACRVGAPCATKWIDEFGYVTIPVLSGTAFLAILVLLAMAWSRERGRTGEDAPIVSPAGTSS